MSFIRSGTPALVLAPMEGVTDAPMRAFMSERGGFTLMVSEFLRVSQEAPPERIIRDHLPELASGGRTREGIPVQLQLLGGDPERLALAAARACELGAVGIDLNFGCPAPTVNRHDGGATLLKYPDRIRAIVAAVRAAVPARLPVSAKLRLGWDDMGAIHVNAERAAEGGAAWISIHGRTKVQGYIPPAYWAPIGEVRRRLGIPVVANGEIWTIDDFRRCRDETGCEHYMLGRGALADPSLAWAVARELGLAVPAGAVAAPMGPSWREWRPLLARFAELSEPLADRTNYTACRIKQWIRYAAPRRGIGWFDAIKKLERHEEMLALQD